MHYVLWMNKRNKNKTKKRGGKARGKEKNNEKNCDNPCYLCVKLIRSLKMIFIDNGVG